MWVRALAATSGCLLVFGVACGDSYDGVGDSDAGASETGSPDVSATNVPPDATPLVDAGARCDPHAPFTEVKRVPGIPSNAFCARFSDDESIVTFSTADETRMATRGPDGAYGVATKVAFTDAKAVCASFSADRKTVYFEDFFNVYVESGPPGGPYSAKTQVMNGEAANLGDPFFDEPRGILYMDFHLTPSNFFANTALGVGKIIGGTTEPARRLDVGFGVTGHDGPQDANAAPDYKFTGATPGAGGLALYFASSTASSSTANPQLGDYDVWVATRATVDTDFSSPSLLDGINTKDSELPSWISSDSCRLYFSSNREHPKSTITDVFVATRNP